MMNGISSLCVGMATTTLVLSYNVTHLHSEYATIDCSFNLSFYCVVCCNPDPSVPPDSCVYNVSSTRSTKVTVYLDGLTSGQVYYCKAGASYTNCCTVGGSVNVYFSFMTPSKPPPPSPPPTSPSGKLSPSLYARHNISSN